MTIDHTYYDKNAVGKPILIIFSDGSQYAYGAGNRSPHSYLIKSSLVVSVHSSLITNFACNVNGDNNPRGS